MLTRSLFRLNHSISRSYGTKVIINKEKNMQDIRSTTYNFLNQTNKQHFIGLVHTYPAWVDFFNIFRNNKMSFNKHSHSAQNPYGHSLIEFFNFQDGRIQTDEVMNVGSGGPSGMNRKDFIHFMPSYCYYLNNKEENNKEFTGNHQNGMLERSYISIVIPVDQADWELIQRHYKDIKTKALTDAKCEFRLASHLITNKLRWLFPSINERGNCTYWTSSGLVKLGMLDSNSSFPMVCFYKLLLNIYLQRGKYFSNYEIIKDHCIVFYKGIHHKTMPKGSYMYPLYWLKFSYNKVWAVEKIANIKVMLVDLLVDDKYDIRSKYNKEEKAKENLMTMIEYLKKIFK